MSLWQSLRGLRDEVERERGGKENGEREGEKEKEKGMHRERERGRQKVFIKDQFNQIKCNSPGKNNLPESLMATFSFSTPHFFPN